MKLYAIAYLGSFAALLVLDAIWLTTMAKSFYMPRIGHLMAENPNFAIAAVFYLFYTLAVVVLAVVPGHESQSLTKALLFGAMFGAAAYGTYDFTNQATLRDWPAIVTVVDIIWGTFLTSVSALGGYFAVKMLN